MHAAAESDDRFLEAERVYPNRTTTKRILSHGGMRHGQ